MNYNFVMCEEALCTWIMQPANAWSNIGMLFIGIFLFWQGTFKKSDVDIFSGLCITFMGACSFGAHATGIEILGILDVSSILVYLSFLGVASVLRSHLLHRKYFFQSWAGLCSLLIVSQLLFPKLKIGLLVVLGIFILLTEAKYIKRNWSSIHISHLVIAILLLFGGMTSLYLDHSRVLCDPQNHFFQLHAIWHVLAAIGMYFITVYLRQFGLKITGRSV